MLSRTVYVDADGNDDWIKKVRHPQSLRATGLLELGDKLGHPFRGNQWSGKAGELDEKLRRTVLDWVTSSNAAMDLREGAAAADVSGQPAEPRIAQLMRAVETSPPTTQELYRGISYAGTPTDVEANFQPGELLHLPLASFSSDRSDANKFAQWQREPGMTEVTLIVEPGTRGLQVPYDQLFSLQGTHDPVTVDPTKKSTVHEYFAAEDETIVRGNFEIVAIRQTSLSDYYNPGADPRAGVEVRVRPT
jgi:hypothetical protein